MGVQTINDAAERGHLIGDVPALFLVAISQLTGCKGRRSALVE
jgi:hypothetical protein